MWVTVPGCPRPGVLAGHGRRPDRTIQISELTAAQYAAQGRGPGFGLVVRQGGQTRAATLAAARTRMLPAAGAITVVVRTYQVLTLGLPGFGTDRVRVSVLPNGALTGSAVGTDRLVAGLLIAGFCHPRVRLCLHCLARIAGPGVGLSAGGSSAWRWRLLLAGTHHGNDEFAALGAEFTTCRLSCRPDWPSSRANRPASGAQSATRRHVRLQPRPGCPARARAPDGDG